MRKVVLIVLCIAAGIVLTALIAFSCFRWVASNDAADFQGTWYIDGTDTPITITENEIRLTPDVVYSYELDPMAKTVDFHFTTLDGQGRYRFSLDRGELAIIDGDFGPVETYVNDLEWTAYALMESVRGEEAPLFADRNRTLLTREPTANQQADEPSDQASGDQASDDQAADDDQSGDQGADGGQSEDQASQDQGTGDRLFKNQITEKKMTDDGQLEDWESEDDQSEDRSVEGTSQY